jgi:monoamine oxidase
VQQKTIPHIIIVGAGAAGLMAARELSSRYKVTILEARDQSGGRIRTIYHPDSTTHLEAGAEFVHGKLPVTLQLLKEARLSYSPANGNMFSINGGKWEQSEEMIEGWDELLNKMEEEKEDLTMLDFLNKYYSAEEHHLLRRHISRYAQGFDLADISRVSLKALLEEWTNESGDNFRVDQGYRALVNFMEAECLQQGCAIHFNTPVKLIEWQEGSVNAYKDQHTVFHADKILVTIPLGLLQSRQASDAIKFVPAIDTYLDASQEMGYGSVIKFVLEFNTPFWHQHKKDIGFMISDETVPTWWTQRHDDTTLTGWLGGPPADELSNATKEQLLATALNSLASIFGMSYAEIQSQLTASHVFNWARDEWADGGYSYATPATVTIRQLFNKAPGDTIYFAGEAFYEGTAPGTVEAALVSGKNVAEKILGNE